MNPDIPAPPGQPGWLEMDALFSRCLDLPAGERGALLERECTDEPMRQRILRLLEASEAGDRLLARRAEMIAELMPEAGSVPLAEGTRLGEYRVVRLVGEGGMARVYLAEQQHGDWRRSVAIKLLNHGDADLISRFRAERRFLAGLEHPGIARLIDTGATADGLPFLVTEYVDGNAITHHCRDHDLPLRDRLALFLQLADAVQYAHGRLVVHRDLKPSNVLVDTAGRLRLLDFGIAKLMAGGEEVPRTRTGMAPMTPEYAAPEQLAGGPIGIAADIYQLGLLLFELAVGEPGWKQWRSGAVGHRQLPRASVAAAASGDLAARRRARELRGDLDAIIARATDEDPAQRYATVQGLANDVRASLHGEKTSVRRDTLPRAAWRLVRANPMAGAAAALALALLAGWGASLQVYSTRLLAERELAQHEALRAQQAKTLLMDVFRAADPIIAASQGGRQVTVWDSLPMAEADARRNLADAPELLAEMLENLATLHERAGREDAAERLLRDALDLHLALPAPDPLALARVRAELGSQLASRGADDEALALMQAAMATVEQDPRAHVDTTLAVWLDQSHALGARGDFVEREQLMRRALALMAEDDYPSVVAEAEARQQLSEALAAQGNWDDALAELELALAKAEQVLGPEHGRLVALLSSRGNVLGSLDRQDESERDLRRALAIQAVWGLPDTPVSLSLRNNLALKLGATGRRGEEQAELRLLLEQQRRVAGEDSLEVGNVLQNLGASLAKTRDLAQAEEALLAAWDIYDARLPTGHPRRAFPHITLALVHLEAGEPERARLAAGQAALALDGALPEAHFAHVVVACLAEEARARQSPGRHDPGELSRLAARLDAAAGAPAEYVQRCRAAAGSAG